jgi:5-methylcytosine-specific restriction endonuclease McrA
MPRGKRELKARATRTIGRQWDTGPTRAQRVQVYLRANSCCERCGQLIREGMDFSVHHRLPRGRGGRNELPNLVLLCGSGVTGCHGQVESQRAASYDTGWLVETGVEPSVKPVLVFGIGHALLTADGGYEEVAA